MRSPIFSRHVRVCWSCSWSERPSSGLSSCFRAFFTGLMRSLHWKTHTDWLDYWNAMLLVFFTHYWLTPTCFKIWIWEVKKRETHNTESFLVEFVIVLSFDWNRVSTSCDVNWTLGLLPFGSFSLEDKYTIKVRPSIIHIFISLTCFSVSSITQKLLNIFPQNMVDRWNMGQERTYSFLGRIWTKGADAGI